MAVSIAALSISTLSLVLAGLALGWQIAQWVLSAGRPKATLMHGVADRSQAWVGPVGKDGRGFDVSRLQGEGLSGEPVVGVQVTNHGRAPVVIETVAMLPRGGALRLVPVGERIGPDLPHTVQPGSNASWYVPYGHADQLVRSSRAVLNQNVSGVYMTAQTGIGKTIETSSTLQIYDGD